MVRMLKSGRRWKPTKGEKTTNGEGEEKMILKINRENDRDRDDSWVDGKDLTQFDMKEFDQLT